MAEHVSFRARYGEWAVIAGGSDGLGAAFAHGLAARGLNCLLVARRQAALDTVAAALQRDHGVEARTLSLDLGADDAAGRLEEATADVDLGVVVFNAGAEATGAPFLDAPFAEWRTLIDRNILFLTQALYGFGRRMRTQARGGLIGGDRPLPAAAGRPRRYRRLPAIAGRHASGGGARPSAGVAWPFGDARRP